MKLCLQSRLINLIILPSSIPSPANFPQFSLVYRGQWFWNKRMLLNLKQCCTFFHSSTSEVGKHKGGILGSLSTYTTTGYYRHSVTWPCVKELGLGLSVSWDCSIATCPWFGRYYFLDTEVSVLTFYKRDRLCDTASWEYIVVCPGRLPHFDPAC